MTMTRNDVHAPKNLITEDYEYVWAFDNQAPGVLVNVDMDWWRSITRWDPATAERGTHQCHHCGAHIRYVAILKYTPTGRNIAVGETCLENRFEQATADFHRLRKAAELDRKAQRIRNAGNEFIADLSAVERALLVKHDEEVAAEITEGVDSEIVSTVRSDSFISDLRRKLWNYGDLSANQLAWVSKKYDAAIARRAQLAAQALETHMRAPEGRMAFEGCVVKTAWYDSDYGSYKKLTVKVTDPSGAVWFVRVNEPKALPNTERGDRVRMTAQLINDNPVGGEWEHFAKGKRPSKAQYLGACDAGPEVDAMAD